MGSDIEEATRITGAGDPLSALEKGESEGKFESALDPLDLFGLGAAGEIEAEGEAARTRVKELMSAAEIMRKSVLERIQERDLQASRTTANIRREALLRRGRASTIL